MSKNYNPSSAGFLTGGGLAVTKYESGCLRGVLAKKNGARTKFPSILAEMGAKFEELSEVWLRDNYPDWDLAVEEVLKGPCVGLPEETFSGRKDFTLRKDGTTIIVECKSMMSSTSRLNVIRKGIMNPSQIAQLISYMIQEKQTKGMMMFGYYEIDPETGEMWCPNAFRDQGNIKKANFAVYRVEITDEGKILIEDQEFEYDVYQCIEHRNAVMDVLKNKTVGLRPFKSHEEYSSPCNYCVFKDVCTDYDTSVISGDPMTADKFIENCITAASNKAEDGPKLKTPKRKPK